MDLTTRYPASALSRSARYGRANGRFPEMDFAESRMQSLFLERERNYEALADLDEDYEAGKLSDTDYQNLREQLLEDTEKVIAQIESVGMASVEAEIEKYRQEASDS